MSELRFQATPVAGETELRLFDGAAALPISAWALSGHRGADLCAQLVVEGAVEGDDVLLIEHAAVARLTAAEASLLDMPPASPLRAVVEGTGAMIRPGYKVNLRWTRPGGQNVLGVERCGAWLRDAEGWRRLPETLFAVAEAVSHHEAAPDEASRLRALGDLRGALPQAATTGSAETSGLLGAVTIVEADAMSLATIGEGDAMQIVPVLHRAGDGPGSPGLLPEDRQQAFGATQFHRWPTARSVYSLPGNIYVTISPPLRQALEVVRQAAAGSPAQRRAFLREPRPAIRAAIGDEVDQALLESLVIETHAWSDRVIGLGLWQPRVLPWIALAGHDWFGGDGTTPANGLMIGDRSLPLTPDTAAALAEHVRAAMAAGETMVRTADGNEMIDVPATAETLAALEKLVPSQPAEPREKPDAPTVLIIKTNETERDIEAVGQSRPAPAPDLPACLRTTPKEHQREGLLWLQQSWIAGSPGVLLADDMGLGKTLQGLAFLAWVREGMAAGQIERRPLLIVAPTGLLQNWLAEHDNHLGAPRLGTPLLAYGTGLAALRDGGKDRSSRLDTKAIAAADWVLTTYETLRDYVSDFGLVHFAVMLLDEAQKVKTPAIRMTDAAKSMNVDFRIAMTGTPVENRLADLWCIVDGVAMGHLGDLRRFSEKYEGEARLQNLSELKASLDRPIGRRPPLLLRRLKEDKLPDLPTREDVVSRLVMGPAQLAAYEAAVSLGRSDQGAGRVLEALQRLRAVSLHPNLAGAADDDGLIAGSARLQLALATLDSIAGLGEKALVFVEDLKFMARLTGLLQRRYRLAQPPMTISGAVSGARRYERVERFQHGPAGFDVMLISPRAGGVGLTLTGANHVIHLTRWWNPAVEDQCTARVLRIGQHRPVAVHMPLATLPDGRPSFDENLHGMLEQKRKLMRDALLPPEPDTNELSAMLNRTLE